MPHKRNKVPITLDRTRKSHLIVDLETPENFGRKFYIIANDRPDLFGKPNTSLRRASQNHRAYLLRLKENNSRRYWSLYRQAFRFLNGDTETDDEDFDDDDEEEEEDHNKDEEDEEEEDEEEDDDYNHQDNSYNNFNMNSPPGSAKDNRKRPPIDPKPFSSPNPYSSPAPPGIVAPSRVDFSKFNYWISNHFSFGANHFLCSNVGLHRSVF